MDWKNMQTTFSWKPILICVGLNLAAAGITFLSSLLLTASVYLTIFYTLFAWTITVTASFLYWIWWFFENIKNVPSRIKKGFTVVMLILLTSDWMIIFGFLGLLI
jgi:hypothetical protein